MSRGSGAQANSPQVRGSAFQQPRRLAIQQLSPHLQLQDGALHPSTDRRIADIDPSHRRRSPVSIYLFRYLFIHTVDQSHSDFQLVLMVIINQSINQSIRICVAPPTNSGRRRLTM